ncbi:MAG: ribosomal-processing cysteine protease Prp [Thermaerobacter sp.]|nr:ribosomal-processing cysteine protease Prp [Thermaerobacter sp.]
MIRAEVRRRGGEIRYLRVRGHADAGPYGHDLVCAAVSAVVQTALLGLREIDPTAARGEILEGDVRWQGSAGPAGQAILAACVVGLRDIARSHSGSLSLSEKEESS